MNDEKLALSVKNVSLIYNSGTSLFRKTTPHLVINDISFELYHGDSIGVIGRNGVGKSTLLRMLSGIIKPNKGEIINYNVDTALLSLNIGFDPNVSGKHNAVMAGIMLGMSRTHLETLLPSIFEYAELVDYIDMPLKNYSTGMRARLSFSVAIHVKSDVLLIDEVLSVGDASFREKSKATMVDKLKSGDTVVLVSHNIPDVRNLCSKVLWIEEGETRMFGSPSDVIPEYLKYMKALNNV